MAPPVEEVPTKVVSTTVVKRQASEGGSRPPASPALEDELHVNVLEDNLHNTKTSSGEARSVGTHGRTHTPKPRTIAWTTVFVPQL